MIEVKNIEDWGKEIIADVEFIFANPYQIEGILSDLCETEKLSLDELFTIKKFCENDWELENFKLNKLGNFDVIYTNGKVFCICWVASKEDKELTIIKFNAFFRSEYKFLDLANNKLMTRII